MALTPFGVGIKSNGLVVLLTNFYYQRKIAAKTEMAHSFGGVMVWNNQIVAFFNKVVRWKDTKLVGFLERRLNWWQEQHPDSFRWFKKNWLHSQLWNLPNLLSFTRGGAVPLIVLLMALSPLWGKWPAFLLCLAASLTDLLDGAIARAAKCITEKGSVIDPFIDKFLFIAIVVAGQIFYQSLLWLPLVVMAVGGEIINSFMRCYKIKHQIKPWSATSLGQTKFVLQSLVIYLLLLPVSPSFWNIIAGNILLLTSNVFLYLNLFQEGQKIINWKKTNP